MGDLILMGVAFFGGLFCGLIGESSVTASQVDQAILACSNNQQVRGYSVNRFTTNVKVTCNNGAVFTIQKKEK